MARKEISIWMDERWADALEKYLPGHDLQAKMEELLDGLIGQLPGDVRDGIRNEIRAEDERMEQEREARRRFSALQVTQNGQVSFFVSEDGMSLLTLSGRIREYINKNTGAPFESVLYRVRESGAAEFQSAVMERVEHTGRVTGVFAVDMDSGRLSTLDEKGGWHQYKLRDLSAAAYAANRKTWERQERRQEIFADKLLGKELTPPTGTQSPAPTMGPAM